MTTRTVVSKCITEENDVEHGMQGGDGHELSHCVQVLSAMEGEDEVVELPKIAVFISS